MFNSCRSYRKSRPPSTPRNFYYGSEACRWTLQISMNVRKLEKLLLSTPDVLGRCAPWVWDYISENCLSEAGTTYSRFDQLALRSHVPYDPPQIKLPEGMKKTLKLHSYQLNAISWMKQHEKSQEKYTLKYSPLVPWVSGHSGISPSFPSSPYFFFPFLLPLSSSSHRLGFLQSNEKPSFPSRFSCPSCVLLPRQPVLKLQKAILPPSDFCV